MIKRKITVEESDILKEIRRNMTREREVIQALGKKDSLTWEEDRIIYMDGRIYVPNNRKTREMILRENHDKANIEHPGQHRMMELIKRTYWWPGLKEDVNIYKDVSNAKRTKSNIKRKQENYIHWIYLEDHGKKSASILLDLYRNQME